MKLPSDVKTRWFSVKHMLEGAYALRAKLDQFANIQQGALRTTALSMDEWNVVKDLTEFLKLLEDISCECSGSTYPTIHLGIPTITHLYNHLDKYSADLDQVNQDSHFSM